MVYSFLVQTLHPARPEILYNQHFGCPYDVGKQQGDDPDHFSDIAGDDCTVRRLLDAVCRRVVSEYRFTMQVSKRNFEDDLERLRDDGTMPAFPIGVFGAHNIVEGQHDSVLLPEGSVVLWCGAGTVAFVVILAAAENRGLGVMTLKLIARLLQEHVQAITSPKEMLLRADHVMLVLEHLLPMGQMVFLNAKMQSQLEKDLERARQR